jgi:hypothetical protein
MRVVKCGKELVVSFHKCATGKPQRLVSRKSDEGGSGDESGVTRQTSWNCSLSLVLGLGMSLSGRSAVGAVFADAVSE